MKKQTVEQRYHIQQMMDNAPISAEQAQESVSTQAQQNYQKLLNSVKQSLQGASQAIQQVRASNPSQTNLMTVANKLTYAVQQMQQLETAGVQSGFTKGTEQQLKQLHYQVETAAGTLRMIQQTME